jgi:hypothetical protein
MPRSFLVPPGARMPETARLPFKVSQAYAAVMSWAIATNWLAVLGTRQPTEMAGATRRGVDQPH